MVELQVFHPDVIVVTESYYEDVAAIGAKFDLMIKGTSLFSGNAAFKKARELATIVEALKPLGVTDEDFTLKQVRVEVNQGVLTKFSSVNYSVRVHCRKVESVGDVLGALANAKSVIVEAVRWQYPENQEDKDRWLRTAVDRAKQRAAVMAESLGVKVSGVYTCVSRYWNEVDLEPQSHYGGLMPASRMKMSMVAKTYEFDAGIQLMGSERRGVEVTVQFRVS